jgi:hypothetical protein
LHVLSMPPAFALSQDQTLRFIRRPQTKIHKRTNPSTTKTPTPQQNRQQKRPTINITQTKAQATSTAKTPPTYPSVLPYAVVNERDSDRVVAVGSRDICARSHHVNTVTAVIRQQTCETLGCAKMTGL